MMSLHRLHTRFGIREFMAENGHSEDSMLGELAKSYPEGDPRLPSSHSIDSYIHGRRSIQLGIDPKTNSNFILELERLYPGAIRPFTYRFWSVLGVPIEDLGKAKVGRWQPHEANVLDEDGHPIVGKRELDIARSALLHSTQKVRETLFVWVDAEAGWWRRLRNVETEIRVVTEGTVHDAFADLLALGLEAVCLEEFFRLSEIVTALKRSLESVVALPGFKGAEKAIEDAAMSRLSKISHSTVTAVDAYALVCSEEVLPPAGNSARVPIRAVDRVMGQTFYYFPEGLSAEERSRTWKERDQELMRILLGLDDAESLAKLSSPSDDPS